MPEPPPSLPDQLRLNLSEFSVAGRAVTLLVGVELSIVTSACLAVEIPWLGSVSLTWSVAIGALVSNVMLATLVIFVPVGRPALGAIT